ncbi:alkaline phosphatase [Gaoshiqia sediminis]|uniref:Alkaline phosphatase n=1 Tax=Gaoshiqia sediminis TaxID=2986998 RepID=A0AA41Y9P6_9BACT|nr:alkaline phosphatase [Gaoshiqia sediminis]MCW0483538.1 alkaline phosphatase [Gaoshiqia sediminis]
MKRMNFLRILSVLFIFSIAFTACNNDDDSKVEPNSISEYKTPKYVFFFIGDGMSTPQINVTEAALNDQDFTLKSASISSTVGIGKLNIRQFPVAGMQTTHAEDRYITCSAAAATALATGYKTTINTIAMNGERTQDFTTMAEMAKAKGMKVGIISSVSIDHATPACFYAHTPDRNNYQEIGQDLIASGFDYFAGGNVRFNKYKDYSLNNFITDATAQGYSYVNTKAGFTALNANSGRVIATLKSLETYTGDSGAMPYAIDLNAQESEDDKITLADFTEKGIELLDNENGFFMMIEGGKIDWACHANDVVSSAMDVVAFDEAIGVALAFYKEHPDETLIVVTGDHECGGLTLGFASTDYETSFDLLKHQTESYFIFTNKVKAWKQAGTKTFEQAMTEVKTSFGLGDESKGLGLSEYEESLLRSAFEKSITGQNGYSADEAYVHYGSYDPFTVTVTHILNNKAGIDWTTFQHTGTPVPVFALGQGQYEFSGYYDNTDIAKKIIEVAKYQ